MDVYEQGIPSLNSPRCLIVPVIDEQMPSNTLSNTLVNRRGVQSTASNSTPAAVSSSSFSSKSFKSRGGRAAINAPSPLGLHSFVFRIAQMYVADTSPGFGSAVSSEDLVEDFRYSIAKDLAQVSVLLCSVAGILW
jgi:hypothetical protein